MQQSGTVKSTYLDKIHLIPETIDKHKVELANFRFHSKQGIQI